MDRSAALQEIAAAQRQIAAEVERIQRAQNRLRLRPLEWEMCDFEIRQASEEIGRQREYIARLRASP